MRYASKPLSAAIITVLAAAGGVAPLAQAQQQSSAAAATDSSAKELDEVHVVGVGSTRTTSEVSKDFIERQTPGLAPQNLLRSLPGVNVQNSDPYALYEWADSMRIRGFDESQLGVTVDGVPIDSSDIQGDGPITRYVLSEDLGDVQVSPGSGDVTQPSSHALGGAVRYISVKPSQTMGGEAGQTIGSDQFTRSFFRFDTGAWWDGGPTAYIAGARTRAVNNQNHEGALATDHIDAKIQQAWDNGSSLTYNFAYDWRKDHDYQDYTRDLQPDYNNWPIYANLTGDPNHDQYYYENWQNGNISWLNSLQAHIQFTDDLALNVTPYYIKRKGFALWSITPSWDGTQTDTDGFDDSCSSDDYPYSAASQYYCALEHAPHDSGVWALSPPNQSNAAANGGSDDDYYGNLMPLQYEILKGHRGGATINLSWDAGPNNLQVGGWFDKEYYYDYRPLWNVDPDTGKMQQDTANGEYPVYVYDQWHFDTKTYQFYVQDTLKLLDDTLTLQAGAKALKVDRHFWGIANASDFENEIWRDVNVSNKDLFQPQVGATYNFTDATQGFVNYAENFSATPRAAMVAVTYNPNIKPEHSKNIDLGVRTEHATWSGYVALYAVRYQDRILELSANLSETAGLGDEYQNVGSEKAYGAEISGEWRFATYWTLNGSLSLSHDTYGNDYYAYNADEDDYDLVPVKGREVPDQPKVSGSLSLDFKAEHWFASIGGKYTGVRQIDSLGLLTCDDTGGLNCDDNGYDLNSGEIKSVALFDGSFGYQGGKTGPLANTRLMFSVYNLGDKKYISSIFPSENGGELKLGAPRQVFASIQYKF